MRQFLSITVFAILANITFGQNINRLNNESVEDFIKRIKPDSTELAHQIIETNTWDSTRKAIIVFYGYDDPVDVNIGFNTIFGHIYLPIKNNVYKDIQFGPFGEDGGYPEIASVFFVNADKDNTKELAVICIRDQLHYDYSGQFYDTDIFDNPNTNNNELIHLSISSHFSGCECNFREAESEVAKFKTAKDVNIELKRMGF